MSYKYMSEDRPFARFRQTVELVLLACLLTMTSPVHADASCANATFMELNSSLRSLGGDENDPLFVELDVPSAGILSFNATAPIIAEVKDGVVVSLACLPRFGSEPVVLERSASHMILAVSAQGTYVFRVASRNPRRRLSELKLMSAFIAETPTAGSRPCVMNFGEDEEEIEVDVDPLVDGEPCIMNFGEDEEEIEVDVDPLVDLDQLCRVGDVDDHGDSFTCATILSAGHAIVGEIQNGWGDDDDIFQFVLSGSPTGDPWTVMIGTTGDVDTVGGLYDRTGQRLVWNDDSGRGDNFRIVSTLLPGSYFVRVTGHNGAEGRYALSVNGSR